MGRGVVEKCVLDGGYGFVKRSLGEKFAVTVGGAAPGNVVKDRVSERTVEGIDARRKEALVIIDEKTAFASDWFD